MSNRSLKFLVLAAPLLLGACGEGYEMVRSDSFPYNNERTAGTGVAYVLAKLMPERELNLEPVTRAEEPKVIEPASAEPVAEPVAETKEILDDLETEMDEIFEDAQKK